MAEGTLLTPILGFILGFALPRGNTCAVRAVSRLVHDRRIDWMVGLLVASCWAGVALLGAALLAPTEVLLPADRDVTLAIVAGGALLGLGTVINDACFVGSIERLGSGDLGFLVTLTAATLAMTQLPGLALLPFEVAMTPGVRMTDGSWWWWAGMLGFAAIALAHAWRNRAEILAVGAQITAPWPYPLVLIVVGVTGGLLFATSPNWSYGAILVALSRGEVPELSFATLAAVMLFAGAGVSAWTRGRFHVRLPGALALLRRLAGGTLMGIAAALIPGGNDALGLWVAPGLALYGVVALLAMVATVTMLVALQQQVAARART